MDHMLRAVELLEESADLEAQLDVEYRKPIPDRRVVADRHDRIRRVSGRAKIHAMLAVAQAVERGVSEADARASEVFAS